MFESPLITPVDGSLPPQIFRNEMRDYNALAYSSCERKDLPFVWRPQLFSNGDWMPSIQAVDSDNVEEDKCLEPDKSGPDIPLGIESRDRLGRMN
jgi:hypothetical protein